MSIVIHEPSFYCLHTTYCLISWFRDVPSCYDVLQVRWTLPSARKADVPVRFTWSLGSLFEIAGTMSIHLPACPVENFISFEIEAITCNGSTDFDCILIFSSSSWWCIFCPTNDDCRPCRHQMHKNSAPSYISITMHKAGHSSIWKTKFTPSITHNQRWLLLTAQSSPFSWSTGLLIRHNSRTTGSRQWIPMWLLLTIQEWWCYWEKILKHESMGQNDWRTLLSNNTKKKGTRRQRLDSDPEQQKKLWNMCLLSYI